MPESGWEQREQRILEAVNEACEKGEDPNRAARSVVPDLSDDVYRETVAALIDGGYLVGQSQRDGSDRIAFLRIARLGPRGLETVGRWPRDREVSPTPSDQVPSVKGDEPKRDKRQWVFLVAGRNNAAVEAMTHLLQAAGLRIVEWGHARAATGKPNPYIGEILTAGMDLAHGVVVLFTPEDVGALGQEFWREDDEPHEHELSARARQNVVFEAGMALGRDENRVVMVEFGILPGFSDLAGKHSVRMDGSAARRKDILDRLATAGCSVDLTGTSWTEAGDFTEALKPPSATYDFEPPGENSSPEDEAGSAGSDSAKSEAGRRRMSSPLNMLQPNSYLDSGPTGHADLLIRCAVLLPDASSRPANREEVLSIVSGELREDALANVLTKSELTGWLERQREPFHLTDLGIWSPHGFNSGDFTRLARSPACVSAGPSPVSLTCDITTGWVPRADITADWQPSIEMVLDIRYRLLDLDEPRQGFFDDSPPPGEAHAKLTIKELYDGLVTCMSVCDLAIGAYTVTIPNFDLPNDGELAVWLTSRADLDDVIDVTGTTVIPGSATNVQYGEFLGLPLSEPTPEMASLEVRRETARAFIAKWLERSGRRGTSGLLGQLD